MPQTYRGSRGLLFEEFEVGTQWESPGRTVTQTDIVMFAGLSGDYNELHTNREYSKDTMFERPIAHGLLGLSIASGLAARLGFVEGTTQAFTGLHWKFKKPIFSGDTVRLRALLRQKRAARRLGGGLVVFDLALVNQDGKVVQQGDWTLLVRGAESK